MNRGQIISANNVGSKRYTSILNLVLLVRVCLSVAFITCASMVDLIVVVGHIFVGFTRRKQIYEIFFILKIL